MNSRFASSLFVVAAVAISGTAADGGRIPIWQSTSIGSPGHYVVTRDIAAPGIVITIASTDVMLDLNGHTITATSPGGTGISVTSFGSSPDVIEVRNGRVRGGTYGVWHSPEVGLSKTRFRLDELDVVATGSFPVWISGAPVVEVLRCNVHDFPGTGAAIVVTPGTAGSFTGTIRDNTVTSVGGGGIQVTAMRGGAVRGNVVTNYGTTNSGDGILFNGSTGYLGGVLIAENTIQNGAPFSSVAINIGGACHRNSVLNNVIEGTLRGITVSSNGNRVSGNVIGNSTNDGIYLSGSDNTIQDNIVESGTSVGVEIVGANNLIARNTIEGFQGCGLYFGPCSSNNAYASNMLRNTAPAMCGSATDAGGNIQ